LYSLVIVKFRAGKNIAVVAVDKVEMNCARAGAGPATAGLASAVLVQAKCRVRSIDTDSALAGLKQTWPKQLL